MIFILNIIVVVFIYDDDDSCDISDKPYFNWKEKDKSFI